jgi:predicted DNA-binding transcriptional regulator AlpA
MGEDLLKAVEVAERLNVADSTLVAWRAQRKGPRWIVTDAGRIRYPLRDLDDWIAKHGSDDYWADGTASGRGRGGSKV